MGSVQRVCPRCGALLRSPNPVSGTVGDGTWGNAWETLADTVDEYFPIAHKNEPCDWQTFCASGLTCQDGVCVKDGSQPVVGGGPTPRKQCEATDGEWDPEAQQCYHDTDPVGWSYGGSEGEQQESSSSTGTIVAAVAALAVAGVVTFLLVGRNA